MYTGEPLIRNTCTQSQNMNPVLIWPLHSILNPFPF